MRAGLLPMEKKGDFKGRLRSLAASAKHQFKDKVLAEGVPSDDIGPFESSFRKGMGTAAAAALGAGALYGAHKLHKAVKMSGGFNKMVEHAGNDFHDLDDHQKVLVRKYYNAISKHSPTVGSDPIAAWNHVKYFVEHPSSYQPQTIEQLQKVESSKPSLFQRK